MNYSRENRAESIIEVSGINGNIENARNAVHIGYADHVQFNFYNFDNKTNANVAKMSCESYEISGINNGGEEVLKKRHNTESNSVSDGQTEISKVTKLACVSAGVSVGFSLMSIICPVLAPLSSVATPVVTAVLANSMLDIKNIDESLDVANS